MTPASASPGARLIGRLDHLSRHSDEPDALTRLFLSPAHRGAADTLMDWMRQAGLEPVLDAIGNVRARYEGSVAGAPALLLGSHIDTVRNAGRYDGALGVAAALGAVEELAQAGIRLPFAVEVVAFGDEEGLRFPTTLSGSRALAGRFDPACLEHIDGDGISMREALCAFGCDPQGIATLARRPEELAGYVEVHIEQGPVLEAAGLPVGVVTAINGASRYQVEVTGVAGHAGTVPMRMRADALAAAAETILAIEWRAQSAEHCVATVGRLELRPNAVNVVPGQVSFTIDMRAAEDRLRGRVAKEILAELSMIAEQRGLSVAVPPTHEAPACPCDPLIMDGLAAAITRAGLPVETLPSGAGHDAMVFAGLCPVGMLFVRCQGGISHHPAEAISDDDAEMAMAVLLDFLMHFEATAPATCDGGANRPATAEKTLSTWER